MNLRKAIPTDASAMVGIKQALPMPTGDETVVGGFLLGASEEQYKGFIERDQVMVLESGGAPDAGTATDTRTQTVTRTGVGTNDNAETTNEIVGFSIILNDATVRQSEIWQKRDAAQLQGVDWSMIEHARLCYFEQLAILPGPQVRWHGQFLALESIVKAMEHHDICFATVVTHPIRNEAAVPYLRRAGFQLIGCIDEVYPEVGPIHSDIYLLTQEGFQVFMQSLGEKFRKRLRKDMDAQAPELLKSDKVKFEASPESEPTNRRHQSQREANP